MPAMPRPPAPRHDLNAALHDAPAAAVCVGVSGGLDSTVLLHLLADDADARGADIWAPNATIDGSDRRALGSGWSQPTWIGDRVAAIHPDSEDRMICVLPEKRTGKKKAVITERAKMSMATLPRGPAASHRDRSTRSPCSVNPQATRTPSLGPSGRTERKTASKNNAATRMS